MSTLQQDHLTDDQVKRLVVVIGGLAKGGNPFGQAMQKSIKGKSLADQRKIIAASYARMFEALLCLDMGINSNRTAEQVAEQLEKAQLTHG
jgi:hypothetical protein